MTFTFRAVWLLPFPGAVLCLPSSALCNTGQGFTVCLCTDSPGAGLGAEPHDFPPCLPEKPILPYIRSAAEGGLIKITALFFPKDNVLGRSS